MNNEGNPSDSGSSSSSDNGGSSSSGRRVLFSRETGNERPRPSSAGSRALDNANYLPRQNQEVLESDSDDSDSEIAPRPLSTQMAFLRRNSTIRPRSVSATEYPLSRDLNRRAIQISRPETPPVLPAVEGNTRRDEIVNESELVVEQFEKYSQDCFHERNHK